MRILTPDIFNKTRSNDNRALDIVWHRPIVFIEVPGTTPYDLYMYWHRRTMIDPNYAGFLDLLVNVRGVKDIGWTGELVHPSDPTIYEQPIIVEGNVVPTSVTSTVAEAFDSRIDFAKSIIANSRPTYIRHYAEPVHADLQQKQDQIEHQLLSAGRIVFVEKLFDPIFQLIRMARAKLPDDAEFEITQTQLDWYVSCVKKYRNLKRAWGKKAAHIAVEHYPRLRLPVVWSDNVHVEIDVRQDQWSQGLGFPKRSYKSPVNFKQADEYLREKLAS